MHSQLNKVINRYTEESNILLEAKTVEEVHYGFVAYLGNGLRIINEVIARLEDK